MWWIHFSKLNNWCTHLLLIHLQTNTQLLSESASFLYGLCFIEINHIQSWLKCCYTTRVYLWGLGQCFNRVTNQNKREPIRSIHSKGTSSSHPFQIESTNTRLSSFPKKNLIQKPIKNYYNCERRPAKLLQPQVCLCWMKVKKNSTILAASISLPRWHQTVV